MNIGILGGSSVAGSLGHLWVQAGHDILIASRHPGVFGLVEQYGGSAQAGTTEAVLRFGEVILEASPYPRALALPAEALADKVLLSASNYRATQDGPLDFGGLSQTELLARRLPNTEIVKAFNTLRARETADLSEGNGVQGRAVLLAGDSSAAKEVAAQLVRDAKLRPLDAGPLSAGRHFGSGGPLFGRALSLEEAKAELEGLGGGS